MRFYKNYFKPLADHVSAFFLLVIFSPIIMLTGICLVFQNRGRIFFIQERPGLNGKIFKIIKFKTMTDDRQVTPLGGVIRKLSIDELLQLVNVLKGDMSIIGPRPLLVKYLERYSFEQAKRHLVKPGITGWAQVNGRNSINWEEKFRLDVEYVHQQSFCLDLKIMWLTIKNLLNPKGINSSDQIIMEEFKGGDKF
jgi:lipopolysaccharide/colanic/teichoic acid biosynthesis glycosyltransferase